MALIHKHGGTKTWVEMAEVSNRYFQNNPIQLGLGNPMIPRGVRQPDALRQYKFLKECRDTARAQVAAMGGGPV